MRGNAVEAVKAYFAPQKMFKCALLERQECDKRALSMRIGNK